MSQQETNTGGYQTLHSGAESASAMGARVLQAGLEWLGVAMKDDLKNI